MSLAAKDAGLTVNGTVKEMMELQQRGGLISEKVLPHFAKRMSEAARANGGLEKALLSNRVAMNRMMFAFQEAADIIFKSGFGEGLTELFNTIAKSVVDLKPLWMALGKIMGSVFKATSILINHLTSTLKPVGVFLQDITEIMGDGSFLIPLTTFTALWVKNLITLNKFIPLIGVVASRLSPWIIAFTAIADTIKLAAMWGEELINLFTHEKIGLLYDPRKAKNGGSGYTLGSGYVEGMISSFGYTPLGQLFKFVDKIDQGLGLPTWFESTTKTPAWFGAGSTSQQTVNVVVSADAEKMGLTVSQSDAVKDSIQTEIRKGQ